jgi:hypothetical protein
MPKKTEPEVKAIDYAIFILAAAMAIYALARVIL